MKPADMLDTPAKQAFLRSFSRPLTNLGTLRVQLAMQSERFYDPPEGNAWYVRLCRVTDNLTEQEIAELLADDAKQKAFVLYLVLSTTPNEL